jgi:D-alanine-D-alanine ligase-like ATP-grasp enzyme
MKPSFVTPILKRLADRAGVKINIEPRYGYAGQVITKSGAKRYFRGTALDINPLGASDIAKDKDYAAYFLTSMGYPVPEGQAFFSPDWAETIGRRRNGIDAGYAYARKLGFPVIVKPNSLSQGSGVTKVHTKREYYQAVRRICRKDRVFLVQRIITGRDYRVVVLDGKVISAYERLPLSVIGDGRTSVLGLLRAKQRQFQRDGRDTMIKTNDPRITAVLKRLGLTRQSIPTRGRMVTLLDNRNLSTGGDAVDVTRTMHPSFKKLCVKITRDMGLRFCGVDLMVEDTINRPVRSYTVLEINAAPGLDHYASAGSHQQQLVDGLYLKVLKALAKGR